MFEINIKVDLFGWIKRKIRKIFCRNEVKPGEIIVLWRDVDEQIFGCKFSADDEQRLTSVAKVIEHMKVKKLEDITGIKKREDSD